MTLKACRFTKLTRESEKKLGNRKTLLLLLVLKPYMLNAMRHLG